jgi:F-type H+-transporting ATPase subunit epsilon
MPHTKFKVEILTPEGEVFNDEVEMISTRTTLGSIGILANHEPVLGMLEPTELRVYLSDTEILRFAQSEGYMQIGGNHAMLLVQEIEKPEDLDVTLLRERLSQAESDLESSGEDSERRRLALREQKRWQAFLEVAEG